MEELIEKVENLKKELDKTKEVKKIKELNLRIKDEDELINNIKMYQMYPDKKLREKIINNSFYREYKHSEVELNFMILNINQFNWMSKM